MRKSRCCRKSAFTLVEIIAVLIVLAILVAVAVPKYFDLTASARAKAVDGAIAEGMSLCSLAYAKAALDNDGEPTIAQVLTALGTPSVGGDFTLSFAQNTGADGITVSAAGKAGTSVEGASTTKDWMMP